MLSMASSECIQSPMQSRIWPTIINHSLSSRRLGARPLESGSTALKSSRRPTNSRALGDESDIALRTSSCVARRSSPTELSMHPQFIRDLRRWHHAFLNEASNHLKASLAAARFRVCSLVHNHRVDRSRETGFSATGNRCFPHDDKPTSQDFALVIDNEEVQSDERNTEINSDLRSMDFIQEVSNNKNNTTEIIYSD